MTVRHRNGEYAIEFQPIAQALAGLPARSVIVTDANVGRLYGKYFPEGSTALVVRAGEGSKSFETFRSLIEQMAEAGADRKITVVAVGGGVVGDLAGFVAATYMRGVPLVQVPTTVLAQVDSSVGGKVGIDIPQGKNLAGAFYPPSKVVVPIDALATLDHRQFNNGMAEVWKYAFIADDGLIEPLQAPDVRQNTDLLERIVRRCIQIKARIVQEDEFERTGLRATLNFGHTVGHAIEHATGYGFLHGEAISIGMVAEAALGERLSVTPSGTADLVAQSLAGQGLPTRSELLARPDTLMQAMRRDKKASGGSLAFSLLTGIGGCKLVEGVPDEDVRAALTTL